jgi:CubicO group peptidase (beta-lactamase class C family)
MNQLRRTPLVIVLALACVLSGSAQVLRPATPESVGLSSERLARLDATMKQYTDEGRIAGVVTLIARRGRVAHLASHGRLDVERNVPMPKDAIFRIASMSKAITSVAAMLLMEEGKLLLSDPVSKFIPGFKKTSVFVPSADGTPAKTAPAKREITIRDLLTHTSGISYGAGPNEAQYKDAGTYMWYFADKNEPIGKVVERMAALPFDAQPGEKYVYGFSTDILGHVVEKASGQSLDEFLRSRILTPLGMTETSFFLPPAKRDRFATVYAVNSAGRIERAPEPQRGQGDYVDGPRICFSGGAGLLSTAADYARFLQMLLNGGELNGARLLSPKTVELMTTNHVGSLYQEGRFGFGLGFEVTEHVGRAGRPGSVGEFGWGGAYYTSFWVDPQEQLVAVFMSQLLPSGGLDLSAKFRALVYQSIVAPGSPAGTPSAPSRPSMP